MKYGLIWEEKEEKVVDICKHKYPVLVEDVSKRIGDCDGEKCNYIIEGENYYSLLALRRDYNEKLDLIYIDPPYNTGNEKFMFNDRIVDKNDEYRHSKYLSFMMRRLKIAKELLKDRGIIIISIDDNELFQLKLLMDRIFDERNFIACLPTIMNLKGNNDQFGFAGTHEYTLIYAKNKNKAKIKEFPINEEELLDEWLKDEYGYYKRGAPLRATGADIRRENRPNMFYPILYNKKNDTLDTVPKDEYMRIYDEKNKKFDDEFLENLRKKYSKLGYEFILPMVDDVTYGRWRWGYSNETIRKIKTDLIIVKSGNGYNLYKKQRPFIDDLPTKKPKSVLYKPEYSSSSATNLLKEILGKDVESINKIHPKPLALIKDLIYLTSEKNSIILDFFAGSGTTGHAVLELNNEDGGYRTFILATNNENNICTDICYQRVKKVIMGYRNSKGEFVQGLGGNLKYYKIEMRDKR